MLAIHSAFATLYARHSLRSIYILPTLYKKWFHAKYHRNISIINMTFDLIEVLDIDRCFAISKALFKYTFSNFYFPSITVPRFSRTVSRNLLLICGPTERWKLIRIVRPCPFFTLQPPKETKSFAELSST